MPLVDAGETCYVPGGCDSCPDRSYCAGLRVGVGMTTTKQEFDDGLPPYAPAYIPPSKDEDDSSQEEV